MAKPLRWNTLEQAARWLSEKTGEIWTDARIIDFSIEYCRPDDISEDIKYPTYLQAILPETQRITLSRAAESQGVSFSFIVTYYSDGTYTDVSDTIRINGDEKKVVILFRDNLSQLQLIGKTRISYIESNDQTVYDHDESIEGFPKPVTIYCELVFNVAVNNPNLKFPALPLVHIDIGMLGIRDEELKQLLRDYLDVKLEQPVQPVVNNEVTGTVDPKQREHDLDDLIEQAIKDIGSDDTTGIFRKLRGYAANKDFPFTGEIIDRHLQYISSTSGEKLFSRDALRKRLSRRKERLKQP